MLLPFNLSFLWISQQTLNAFSHRSKSKPYILANINAYKCLLCLTVRVSVISVALTRSSRWNVCWMCSLICFSLVLRYPVFKQLHVSDVSVGLIELISGVKRSRKGSVSFVAVAPHTVRTESILYVCVQQRFFCLFGRLLPSPMLEVLGKRSNLSESAGIKADDVTWWVISEMVTLLRVRTENWKEHPDAAHFFSLVFRSREAFVLGSQILTRHRSVPWKSSWHIVHKVVLLPVKQEQRNITVIPWSLN